LAQCYGLAALAYLDFMPAMSMQALLDAHPRDYGVSETGGITQCKNPILVKSLSRWQCSRAGYRCYSCDREEGADNVHPDPVEEQRRRLCWPLDGLA